MLSSTERPYIHIRWAVSLEAILPVVHWVRRRSYRGLPKNQSVLRVSYRDKLFHLVYRRWTSDLEVIDQCFAQAQYDLPGGPRRKLIQTIVTLGPFTIRVDD